MKRISRILCLLMVCVLLISCTASASYTYYGDRLKGSEKTVYNKLLKSALSGTASVTFSYETGSSFQVDKINLLVNDCPTLYWLGGYTRTVGVVLNDWYIKFTPSQKWKNAYGQRVSYNKKVKAAIKTIKRKCKGKSAVKKAEIALQWLAAHCKYKSSIYDQSTYGVFVKKGAVCAGYARAYKLILDELNIPCICVSGIIDNEEHMINLVKLKGKWYYVDPTWCDAGKKARYTYFLLGKNNNVVRFGIKSVYGVKLPTLAKKGITKY